MSEIDKYQSVHGFVIGFLYISGEEKFTNLKEIFNLIRKYTK
jgi:hypothetical protein